MATREDFEHRMREEYSDVIGALVSRGFINTDIEQNGGGCLCIRVWLDTDWNATITADDDPIVGQPRPHGWSVGLYSTADAHGSLQIGCEGVTLYRSTDPDATRMLREIVPLLTRIVYGEHGPADDEGGAQDGGIAAEKHSRAATPERRLPVRVRRRAYLPGSRSGSRNEDSGMTWRGVRDFWIGPPPPPPPPVRYVESTGDVVATWVVVFVAIGLAWWWLGGVVAAVLTGLGIVQLLAGAGRRHPPAS